MKNLKVSEILGEVKRRNEDLSIFVDSFVDYNESSCICDIITELADSEVDIYNSDLLKWAGDNSSYIDDAINEFGTEKTDFYKIIQMGQYLYYNEELNDNINDYILVYAYDYIINNLRLETIAEEKREGLESELINIDNNDKLEDIQNKVREVLQVEEEN